jgi:putative flippase GtrA
MGGVSTMDQLKGNYTMATAFLRYLLTGSGMSAAIYLGYLGATSLHFSPVLAISLIYPLAVGSSYFLNRRFTFRSARRHRESTWRFILAHTAGYLLNVGLLWVFTQFTLIDHKVAEALVLVTVGMFLFVVLRVFVFPNEEDAEGPHSGDDS